MIHYPRLTLGDFVAYYNCLSHAIKGSQAKGYLEALGHTSVAFTMDVYSHIIEEMQSDAMALLDEVLPVPRNGHMVMINTNSGHYVE